MRCEASLKREAITWKQAKDLHDIASSLVALRTSQESGLLETCNHLDQRDDRHIPFSEFMETLSAVSYAKVGLWLHSIQEVIDRCGLGPP